MDESRSICGRYGYRPTTVEHQIICIEGRSDFVIKDVTPTRDISAALAVDTVIRPDDMALRRRVLH